MVHFSGEKNYLIAPQNIHLVKTWLPALEKKIEEYSEGSHSDYREEEEKQNYEGRIWVRNLRSRYHATSQPQ